MLLPGGILCQYGLDIKAGSPFKFTFPVSLANDCIGYVPTEVAAPRPARRRLRNSANWLQQPGTRRGRQMADTLIEFSKQLKPGPTPQPPALPPFADKAWTYGDVPPELRLNRRTPPR